MADLMRQLEQLATEGWDGIDDAGGTLRAARETVARAEQEEYRRQVQIFRDCFLTDAGRQALALLRLKTIDRPPTVADLSASSCEAFALAQAREIGARNLIFMIEAALVDEPDAAPVQEL